MSNFFTFGAILILSDFNMNVFVRVEQPTKVFREMKPEFHQKYNSIWHTKAMHLHIYIIVCNLYTYFKCKYGQKIFWILMWEV
jgi:hypothetical protein